MKLIMNSFLSFYLQPDCFVVIGSLNQLHITVYIYLYVEAKTTKFPLSLWTCCVDPGEIKPHQGFLLSLQYSSNQEAGKLTVLEI